MSEAIQQIFAISGGYANPSPRDSHTGLPIGSLNDEYGWIAAFGPQEGIYSVPGQSVEIEVLGFDEGWNPEKDSDRTVIVKLWRLKGCERGDLVYQVSVRRSALRQRPALVYREL